LLTDMKFIINVINIAVVIRLYPDKIDYR
jgi:hypothetical protein